MECACNRACSRNHSALTQIICDCEATYLRLRRGQDCNLSKILGVGLKYSLPICAFPLSPNFYKKKIIVLSLRRTRMTVGTTSLTKTTIYFMEKGLVA